MRFTTILGDKNFKPISGTSPPLPTYGVSKILIGRRRRKFWALKKFWRLENNSGGWRRILGAV